MKTAKGEKISRALKHFHSHRQPLLERHKAEVQMLLNALQAARYAMHMVRRKNYADLVGRGEILPSDAARLYKSAMDNYDEMMESAKSGCFAEAIEREMAEFHALPEAAD